MKEFLTAKGVPFQVRDVAGDPSAREELEREVPDAAGLPIIRVGSDVIRGFDRRKLQEALHLN